MRSRCLLGAVCSMVVVVGVMPPAWAEDPPAAPPRKSFKWTGAPFWSVRLVVKLGPGWGACARLRVDAKRMLRDEVAGRLGYDPFIPYETFLNPDPNAEPGSDASYATALLKGNNGQPPMQKGEVAVRLSATNGSVSSSTTWINEAGKPMWEHPYGHTIAGVDRYSCTEIVRDLTSTIWYDFPLPDFAPLPAPVSCPEQPPTVGTTPPPCRESMYSIWPGEWPMPPLEKPKPDPPKPLDNWPVAIRFSAATWVEMIASGWGSLGFSGGVGARYHAISLDAEVHGDPALGSQVYPNVGDVTFARISGALLLCAHFGWFAACGVGESGRFLFPNHVKELPSSTFYGAAGVRLNLNFPVAPPRLFLHLGLDLRAPIQETYTAKGTTLFATAGPSVGVGIGLLAELPAPFL